MEALDNLVKINAMSEELPDQRELDGIANELLALVHKLGAVDTPLAETQLKY